MYFTTSDILARRKRLEEKWNQQLNKDEAVLIYSGDPIQKPGGLDQTYPFLPHPAYFWLTGRRRETEVVLYNKEIGWVEFHKHITIEEAIWENERTDILVPDSHGQDKSDMDSFLSHQHFTAVYRLGQSSLPVSGKAFDLRTSLDQERRKKDTSEIALIENIAKIARSGYQKIDQILAPGISEKQVQVAYESEILLHGAHGVPYDTIVGSGVNSAILHALPTHRKMRDDEFVLIDAGAEIFDYCVDITRVCSTQSNPSDQHKSLYQLVLQAHAECIAMSKPEIRWHDVHLHAARVLTEGLQQLGLLRGSVDTLMEKAAIYPFFPHGVGHLVGLRVRDAGHEENITKAYAGANLRVDVTLEAGHFITVEPGCYFIPALLDNDKYRTRYRDEINWNEVEKWKHIGGVRIEDNILITETGNRNLTASISKTQVFN